jgi:ATP-dependent DNA helicase RecG
MAKQRQQYLPYYDSPEALLTPEEIYSGATAALLSRLCEDVRIERKSARVGGETVGIYLSMWANTQPDGGVLVVGQNDDGTFEGCSSLNQRAINRIETAGYAHCPDAHFQSKRVGVTNRDGDSDFVLVFRVHYNSRIVVKTTKGEAYIRRGDEKHRLSAEEIRELAHEKGQVSFEEEPVSLRYPDDFDEPAMESWASSVKKKMDAGHDLTAVEIAANRFLGKLNGAQFEPNAACALIFSKNPRRIFPGSKIRFMRFEGDEEGTGEQYNAVKDIWIEGNIPEIISRADEVISSQLRTFSPIGKDAKFTHVDEYPKLAWYEAVVNACVHRSYGNGMKNIPVFVKMFDSKLVIESPGPFPPFVDPQNIYSMHVPRNPRLMEALFFLDLVKMSREGTRRMRDTMQNMGLPAPEFSQKQISHALVRVTLRNKIAQRKALVDFDVSKLISEAIAADLTEREKRLVNWIAERQTITINGAVKLLGISWQSAQKILFSLCKKRILQYVRFREFEKDVRDPKAFFRLRSSDPLPIGGFEQPID